VTVDLAGASLRIVVVGVGGAGMGAIAEVLAGMGHRVAGTDQRASTMTERLAALGVEVTIGHDASVVEGADLVTASTAVAADSPELTAARAAGVPVLRRAEVLAAICASRPSIAVGGTHGKTTTTSMLAVGLREAGLDPSFVIGGEVTQLGTGAHWGDGRWFVVEADESDGTFVELPRVAAIVTNVEPDHLEHHGGFDRLVEAFDAFVAGTDGPVVVCADEPTAAAVALRRRSGDPTATIRTYGTDAAADYHLVEVARVGTGANLDVRCPDGAVERIELAVPGLHNARNAVAAFAVAAELGVDRGAMAAALGRYGGVRRRFEGRGEECDVLFVDDYAHLPTEVDAAVATAAGLERGRVVAVFQPHRYSRTEALWSQFADSFEGADLLVVTDVYPSGEPPRPGVTGRLVVQAVLDAHPWAHVAYLPGLDDVVAHLPRMLRPGDVCLTLGAGDVTRLPDELISALRASGCGRRPVGASGG
jgi:UDP-N-acetylmuramate--alanine ligase